MRNSVRFWSLLTGLALVAAACGEDTPGGPTSTSSVPPNDSPPAASLDGTSWVVVGGSLDDLALVPVAGRPPTLSLGDRRATGSTGCNTYGAEFTLTPAGVLSLTGFAVTEIGCERELMEFEAGMLAALARVDRFTLDGDQLGLRSGAGTAALDLVAAPPVADTPLDAVTWQLTGFTVGGAAISVLAGTEPTLIFDPTAGAVRGNGGCNDFGAQLVLAGTTMTVTEMIHTEMACADGVMGQEAEFFRMLAGAEAWEVDDDRLTVSAADGKLTFSGVEPQLPAEAAAAWVRAIASGDLEAAAALMAPESQAYVDERGGLARFAAELAEGWGAWDAVEDRRISSVSTVFTDGTRGNAAVFVGTIQQEGMTERRAVALITVGSGVRQLVHPFADTEPVGFVVPGPGFDQLAADTPFEVAMPAGFEGVMFLDGSGPLMAEVEMAADGTQRLVALSGVPPVPGEHTLAFLYQTDGGSVGARAVLFTTTG